MIQNTHSVASACNLGTVHIFNIEHQRRAEKSFSKTVYTGIQTVRFLDKDEGSVFDIRHYDALPSSVLMYATQRGNIHGWDLRMKGQGPQESFLMRNSPNCGLLTSVSVDPAHNWVVVGSDLGVYTIWDLRFQIPVRSFSHPTGSAVVRMANTHHPRNCIFSSNANNTVTLWDIEANMGKHVLRINPLSRSEGIVSPNDMSPPLENLKGYTTPVSISTSSPFRSTASDRLSANSESLLSFPARGARSNSIKLDSTLKSSESMSDLSDLSEITADFPKERPNIRAMLVPPEASYVITGGSDAKIRFWDLQKSGESYTVSGLQSDQKAKYSSDSQKGVSITQENTFLTSGAAQGNGVRSANAGLAVASPAHRDCITDLSVVNSTGNSQFLVSGDRAGVIKVWL
jgi:phosphoinositide-3-kinase regulatory subunit 4